MNFTWVSKTALGPPALGQFWSPSAGIFSRVPRKKDGILAQSSRQKVSNIFCQVVGQQETYQRVEELAFGRMRWVAAVVEEIM